MPQLARSEENGWEYPEGYIGNIIGNIT